jgi:hypothetical protein
MKATYFKRPMTTNLELLFVCIFIDFNLKLLDQISEV